MTDDKFLAAFEACRLARKDWTHDAHVRMAWLYATRLPSGGAALARVRSGIQRLNAAFTRRQQILCRTPGVKPKEMPTVTGYHETITTAFVALIASRLEPGEDFDGFRARNPDLFDRKLSALLRHYTPTQLFSERAKSEFVEPNLQPLPTSGECPESEVR